MVAPKEEMIDETINEKDLRTQVLKIVNYFLSFLGLIAVIGMVYSGFLMVTAAMDEGQYEKGKKGIGYIAIGIIVILLSFAVVNWLIDSGGEPGDSSGGTSGGTENNNVTVPD